MVHILCTSVAMHTAGYKSTLWPTNGIAFISDVMHRYSPSTVINTTQTMLIVHHQNVTGRYPLTSQHPKKCPRCTVAEKSRHCLVHPTTNHSTKALKNAPIVRVNTTNIKWRKLFLVYGHMNFIYVRIFYMLILIDRFIVK